MLNHELKDLIKKYRLHKKRNRNKNIIKVFILLLITGITFYYFKKRNTDPENDLNRTLKVDNRNLEKNISKDTFHSQLVETPTDEKNDTNTTQEIGSLLEETIPDISTKDSKKLKKTQKSTLKKDEKPHINKFHLQLTTKKRTLKQLVENYERHTSYSNALSIAEYAYSKKRYKDAVKWAVTASKINKYEVAPWLIYAKSKRYLGDIEKAKKALEIFLKQRESKEARKLLESL